MTPLNIGGTQVAEGMTAKEALTKGGLDWTVKQTPVLYQTMRG